ncbi:hypothetical protein pdam_00019529 [Pocillopora damicornis]|uniref:Uncharacterized protein n=1 Tax=Pocillopora damicornis TaxID=46731 RepID=A0A3M6V2H7_POCDA|nr:hypothetical protein pdam_00019529 [Pocillopora damicornis]
MVSTIVEDSPTHRLCPEYAFNSMFPSSLLMISRVGLFLVNSCPVLSLLSCSENRGTRHLEHAVLKP